MDQWTIPCLQSTMLVKTEENVEPVQATMHQQQQLVSKAMAMAMLTGEDAHLSEH